jgi:2-oxoglutarate dehydrogenase E1 component
MLSSHLARALPLQKRIQSIAIPFRRSSKQQQQLASLSTSTAKTIEYEAHDNETFLTGTSSVYAEQMYEQYQHDPESVHASWKTYFDNLNQGIRYNPREHFTQPTSVINTTKTNSAASRAETAPSDSLGIAHLIRAYQVNGHLAAKLDPLDLYSPEAFPRRPSATEKDGYPAFLTPDYHGFTEADMDRRLFFRGNSTGGNKGYLEELANSPDKVTLRTILQELRNTYCGTLGVEYMHIGDTQKVSTGTLV